MAFWSRRDGYQEALRAELARSGTSGRIPAFGAAGRGRVGTTREVTGSACVVAPEGVRAPASFVIAQLTDAVLVAVTEGDPADEASALAAALAAIEIERMAKEELRGAHVADGLRAALRRAHARLVEVRARVRKLDGGWSFAAHGVRRKGLDGLAASVAIGCARAGEAIVATIGGARVLAVSPAGVRSLGAPSPAPLGDPSIEEAGAPVERVALAEGERIVAVSSSLAAVIDAGAARGADAIGGPVAGAAARFAAVADPAGTHAVAIAIPTPPPAAG